MSGERLEPLDAELTALVEAERQRPELPAAAQQQLWAGLAQAIGGGGGGPGPGGGGGGHGAGMGGGGALGTAGRIGRFFARRIPFGVTAFTIGGLAGAGLHATWTARPQPGALSAPRSVEAPPPPPVNAPPAPVEEPVPAPGATPPTDVAPVNAPVAPAAGAAEPARRRTAHVATRPADEGEPDTELATERTLVETARTALARGDLNGALELLERHARRFAHGRLAEERDSLRVQALAKAGRGSEARALATRFYEQYPNSMLRPLVDAALAAIP